MGAKLNTTAKKTFRLDVMRSSMAGIVEGGWETFAILIVTRYFDGTAFEKSLTAGALMLGMLAHPITIFYCGKLKASASRISAFIYFAAAAFLIIAVIGESALLFIVSGAFSIALLAQQMPLLIHVYAENFAASQRGKLVSLGLSAGVVCSIPFAYFGGKLLDYDFSLYRYLYVVMAGAAVVAGVITLRIPSSPVQPSQSKNPISSLSLIWKNKVFGALILMWTFLGFGNLSTIHLRVEYMTTEVYGILASNRDVAICMMAIPASIRILFIPLWGLVFDRFDFFAVRAVNNVCFILAISLFFFADSMAQLYLASIAYGLGNAGARVNWNLWVTKFAPPGEESAYMSAHGFMTGTRGCLAPFIGFYLIQAISIQQAAYISLGLIIFATAMIWPISQLAKRQENLA